VAIAGSDFDVSGSAACPAGKVAVGGGLTLADPAGDVVVAESHPTAGGGGWAVTVLNNSFDANSMTPYAICANAA
jgi:hypothetical protein